MRVSCSSKTSEQSILSIDYWKKQVLVHEPAWTALSHSSPIKKHSMMLNTIETSSLSPTWTASLPHQKHQQHRRFVFDSVFNRDDTQIELSSHIMLGDGLLMHVLSGRDACVFTFGQNRRGTKCLANFLFVQS